MNVGLGFVFFRIGDIMAVLRQGETWPEFSEFAIISKKIGENKGESLWYNDKGRGSTGEVGVGLVGVGTVKFHE